MKLLFIENHADFAQIVVAKFLAAHEVTIVPSLAVARRALAGSAFDAVLVDYDLDDGKGDVLVRELRGAGSRVRIIGVSARDEGNAALLAAGADAAVSKMQFAEIERVLLGLRDSPEQRRQRLKVLKGQQDQQSKDGGRIGYHLIKTGAIEEAKLTDFLSKRYGVPAINLKDFDIDPEIVKLVPREVCEKHIVIPVNRAGASLIIATSDPSNVIATDEIRRLTGYQIEFVAASETAIRDSIERYYPTSSPPEGVPGDKP